jgi:hypothetical protein
VKSAAKQFVVQQHRRGDDVHWDVMFEGQGVLTTYRSPLPPERIAEGTVVVEKIFGHDLKFLTYEGPVNKGRGEVHIVDSGTFEMFGENEKKLKLRVEGKILCGDFILHHIEGDLWRFFKEW